MEAGVIPNRLQDPPAAIARSQAFAQGFLHAGGSAGKEFKSTTTSRVSGGLPNNSHRRRDIRFCGIFRSSAGSTPRASERRPTTLRLA
jgi:hypothetical protein